MGNRRDARTPPLRDTLSGLRLRGVAGRGAGPGGPDRQGRDRLDGLVEAMLVVTSGWSSTTPADHRRDGHQARRRPLRRARGPGQRRSGRIRGGRGRRGGPSTNRAAALGSRRARGAAARPETHPARRHPQTPRLGGLSGPPPADAHLPQGCPSASTTRIYGNLYLTEKANGLPFDGTTRFWWRRWPPRPASRSPTPDSTSRPGTAVLDRGQQRHRDGAASGNRARRGVPAHRRWGVAAQRRELRAGGGALRLRGPSRRCRRVGDRETAGQLVDPQTLPPISLPDKAVGVVFTLTPQRLTAAQAGAEHGAALRKSGRVRRWWCRCGPPTPSPVSWWCCASPAPGVHQGAAGDDGGLRRSGHAAGSWPAASTACGNSTWCPTAADRARSSRPCDPAAVRRGVVATGAPCRGRNPRRYSSGSTAPSTNCRPSSRRSAPRSSTCTAARRPPPGCVQRIEDIVASFSGHGLRAGVHFVGPLSVVDATLADHAEAVVREARQQRGAPLGGAPPDRDRPGRGRTVVRDHRRRLRHAGRRHRQRAEQSAGARPRRSAGRWRLPRPPAAAPWCGGSRRWCEGWRSAPSSTSARR